MNRSGTRRAFLFAAVGSTVAAAGCLSESDPEDSPDEHAEPDSSIRLDDDRALSAVFPFELYDVETADVVAQTHWHGDGTAHWHYQPVELTVGESRTLRIEIDDTEGESISLGPDAVGNTEWHVLDAVPDAFLELAVDGDRIDLTAETDGSAVVSFDFSYDGEHIWETPALEIVAGEPSETLDYKDYETGSQSENGDGNQSEADGHDHGEHEH